MKKLLTLLAVGSIAFGVVSAAAATLGGVTGGANLGAGNQVTASCDSDGVTITYATAYTEGTYKVSSITIDNIAPACNSQTLRATVYGGSDSSTNTEILNDAFVTTLGGIVDTNTDSTTYTFATKLEAKAINGTAILITKAD